MLHRDYITQMVERLGNALERYLRPALLDGDLASIEGIEAAVAELLDLDAATALALDPASLTMMLGLSGVGESVAGYAAYALLRTGDAYERAGQHERAAVRRAQAAAVAQAFAAELGKVPEEYVELERSVAAGRGEE